MNYLSSSLAGLVTFTSFCSCSWANTPIPEATGFSIQWPVVIARSINVHRGDGSYVTSLPGNSNTWEASEPGDYFLVAASEDHWSEWPRSSIVTVAEIDNPGAPIPYVDNYDGVLIYWQSVPAISINVHRGDGSFVESLPGDSIFWLPLQLGEYFLVATNNGDWQTWPRSETIEIINPNTTNDVITGIIANTYGQTAAEVFWDRLPGSGIRYQVTLDDEVVATINGTSWYYDNFSAGSTSLISVKAIYADGDSSNKRSIAVMTPGTQSVHSPVINPGNYQGIVKDVLEVYFGVQYREQLRELANETRGDMLSVAYPDVYTSVYECVNDGQTYLTNPYILDFENCDEGDAVYNGTLNVHAFEYDDNRISSNNGLTITTELGEVLRFAGSLRGPLNDFPGSYIAENLEISLSTANGDLEVSESDFHYYFPHQAAPHSSFFFSASFGGNFVLKSSNTNMQKISVSTPDLFRHTQLFTERADWNFSKGILSISADDGSRLVINANTDNDDTVLVQLVYNSVVEQFEQVWDPEWTVWREFANLQ